jgi:nucleoside-diphosphate-sugar epimerase
MYEKTSLLPFISDPNFTFIKGDVRDDSLLKREVPKHDILIPLAALVGAPLCDRNPVDAELINFRHVKVINDLKSVEQKIIYPNTNSGYGSTVGTELITEESPLTPISIYGTTKCRAENEIQQGQNWTTLRLATVFGVSLRPRFDLLVNNLVLRAMKDKMIVLYENQSMRNYIHVEDICNAFVHCIENTKTINNTFNVGNDALNCTKLDLVKAIQKQIPLEIIQAEYTKDPDGRNYQVSSQKIYDTGFKCEYDLAYGITELKKSVELVDYPVNSNY